MAGHQSGGPQGAPGRADRKGRRAREELDGAATSLALLDARPADRGPATGGAGDERGRTAAHGGLVEISMVDLPAGGAATASAAPTSPSWLRASTRGARVLAPLLAEEMRRARRVPCPPLRDGRHGPWRHEAPLRAPVHHGADVGGAIGRGLGLRRRLLGELEAMRPARAAPGPPTSTPTQPSTSRRSPCTGRRLPGDRRAQRRAATPTSGSRSG